VLCIFWRVGDIPSSAYSEAFYHIFSSINQSLIFLAFEKRKKVKCSLLHHIAMRRRVYLLESVCSRGPFPPVPLPHALAHFPSALASFQAPPRPSLPAACPGECGPRAPCQRACAVKAAMLSLRSPCREAPDTLGMIVHSPLRTPFLTRPTGCIFGPSCGAVSRTESTFDPLVIILGDGHCEGRWWSLGSC
jgi:hypothetical protein